MHRLNTRSRGQGIYLWRHRLGRDMRRRRHMLRRLCLVRRCRPVQSGSRVVRQPRECGRHCSRLRLRRKPSSSGLVPKNSRRSICRNLCRLRCHRCRCQRRRCHCRDGRRREFCWHRLRNCRRVLRRRGRCRRVQALQDAIQQSGRSRPDTDTLLQQFPRGREIAVALLHRSAGLIQPGIRAPGCRPAHFDVESPSVGWAQAAERAQALYGQVAEVEILGVPGLAVCIHGDLVDLAQGLKVILVLPFSLADQAQELRRAIVGNPQPLQHVVGHCVQGDWMDNAPPAGAKARSATGGSTNMA
mmetsp:Transcript_124659/g.358057  ORF Transcript_124659/g.358057 Transcript_124659/m.358057 type:complete len:301 (+) Transcript_124659:397-1299(+)